MNLKLKLIFSRNKKHIKLIYSEAVANSQGRNLGCLVYSARTSGLSSTQGMVRGRAVIGLDSAYIRSGSHVPLKWTGS